jgi:hypothetical protein
MSSEIACAIPSKKLGSFNQAPFRVPSNRPAATTNIAIIPSTTAQSRTMIRWSLFMVGLWNQAFAKRSIEARGRVRCSALLAIRITFNRCVFALSTREAVENLAMPLQTVLIIADLVLPDPLNQLSEHGRLILWRGKFFGFPRPTMTMSHTDLNPRIQKSQFRAIRKRGLDQITVTTLYNPSVVALDEIVKQTQAHLKRLPFRTVIPGDFI